MEKKLKSMFDFQRFEGNRSLAGMIRETEERSSRMLTEDELALVAGGRKNDVNPTRAPSEVIVADKQDEVKNS